MISGGRRYKHTTCEPHSTVSGRAVWSVEADDTNIQLVNLTLQSQTVELYDQWRQTIQVEADDTNIQLVNLTLQSQTKLYDQWRQTIQTYNLWTSLNSLRKSCMISGGRRHKHTTCKPHSTVSGRALWSVEADDTNIQLVNLTLQSQAELYDQWRQTIQTYNLWTSLYSLRQSCMISGGRRYKHTTCEPHSAVSDKAVWSVEADDTNIQLVNLTQQSQKELYDQWRQTIQTYNLWTSLNSLRKSCMISGGRRYKHTTCEPHSTVSERAVWSVEADDTNIQLVNLTQQSQKELYDQWRQTIQTYNLWTSLYSLRQSCMISGGRRYKHTTCEPHSTVSDRAVWSVEADDTNIQLVNLTLQSQTKSCMISGGRRYKHTTCEPHSTVSERAVWSVEADDTNIQLVNLTLQSQTELYDQWRQTIQTYNLWTSLYSLRQSCMNSGGKRYKHTTCEPHSYSLRQSCMISGGRRYKHITCEPHSTVSDRAVWSVEADDTNIQLVNLTLQSQTELYEQWRQTIQTYNLWTSLCSLRQSCIISGGRRYKHTTCEPHSAVTAAWSVEADDTNIQLVNLTLQSQTELYDQWRQTIQTYNLWTSFYSLRQSCMISGGKRYKHTTCEPHSTVRQSCVISGGRRYKHTTCEPHSTVSDSCMWRQTIQTYNLWTSLCSLRQLYDQWRQTIQTYNLWTSFCSLKQLYDQWRQTIQTYNLWTSLFSLRQSCMISGGRRYKHTTCEPHSAVSDSCMISGGRRYKHTNCEPHSAVSDSCMISGGRRYKHTTCEPHSAVTDSLRQSMISGGRRYKHTTCEPHSTVSDRAVWTVEADDTNIQLVNLTLQL